MSVHGQGDRASGAARTTVERTSDRELVVRRTVDAPARLVFEAWTRPDLFQRWWAPASSCVRMLSKEMDVRTGGSYRLLMAHPSLEEPMTFFGRYLEATPPSRLVWTNEEGEEGGALTTVTFEEVGEAIFQMILQVASGRKQTCADRWGLSNEFVLFNPAPIT